MKHYDRRDDWGGLWIICLLSAICWLALFGGVELIRMVWP